jgi:uracil-DNA glycosylase family 4
MPDRDPRADFAELVLAFANQLRRERRRGRRWIPAGPLPGRGASDTAAPLDEPANAAVGLPHLAPKELDEAARRGSETLDEVRSALGDCTRCRLHEGRRNIVFGVGSSTADLMFIGEAPGMDEDRQGEPFVGKAGQLLTRMIAAMGLTRDEVYIANIIKCRPPRNRNPEPDEVRSCEPFLRRQVDAIAPRMIIALGNFAAKTLLGTTTGITRLRGQFQRYQGIPLMPTFHPAYLLRNPDGKKLAWGDLQQVMAEMDRLGLPRGR